MKTKIIVTILAAIVAASVNAESMKFDFKDPKGINNIRFDLDAPLESISGTGNGVSGKVSFDPADPSQTKGSIVLETKSLIVANPVMREHMLGENWLNAEENSTITFTTESFTVESESDSKVEGTVAGTLELNGVTKEISAPASLVYLPGKLADRTNGQATGDLLVIRSKFEINRSEYNIMPGQATDKVAEEIVISLAIAGAFQK